MEASTSQTSRDSPVLDAAGDVEEPDPQPASSQPFPLADGAALPFNLPSQGRTPASPRPFIAPRPVPPLSRGPGERAPRAANTATSWWLQMQEATATFLQAFNPCNGDGCLRPQPDVIAPDVIAADVNVAPVPDEEFKHHVWLLAIEPPAGIPSPVPSDSSSSSTAAASGSSSSDWSISNVEPSLSGTMVVARLGELEEVSFTGLHGLEEALRKLRHKSPAARVQRLYISTKGEGMAVAQLLKENSELLEAVDQFDFKVAEAGTAVFIVEALRVMPQLRGLRIICDFFQEEKLAEALVCALKKLENLEFLNLEGSNLLEDACVVLLDAYYEIYENKRGPDFLLPPIAHKREVLCFAGRPKWPVEWHECEHPATESWESREASSSRGVASRMSRIAEEAEAPEAVELRSQQNPCACEDRVMTCQEASAYMLGRAVPEPGVDPELFSVPAPLEPVSSGAELLAFWGTDKAWLQVIFQECDTGRPMADMKREDAKTVKGLLLDYMGQQTPKNKNVSLLRQYRLEDVIPEVDADTEVDAAAKKIALAKKHVVIKPWKGVLTGETVKDVDTALNEMVKEIFPDRGGKRKRTPHLKLVDYVCDFNDSEDEVGTPDTRDTSTGSTNFSGSEDDGDSAVPGTPDSYDEPAPLLCPELVTHTLFLGKIPDGLRTPDPYD